MTTTKQYDYLNRLTSIASAPSAASAVSYGYSYKDANQRTRVNLADGSFWDYEYDALGQVKSGKRYLLRTFLPSHFCQSWHRRYFGRAA